MQRNRLLLVLALLGFVAVAAVAGTLAYRAVMVDDVKISLKVLVPHEGAKVTINGKATEGTGETRKIDASVEKGKEVVVAAVWEPNSYTKITRKRKVELKEGEITVDLRKADTKNPDDIVVIFVPTPQDVVEGMCRMAKVGKDDIVYDLGCGDGRMVITAVQKFGAKKGVGVDLDPKLVAKCKASAKEAKVDDRVEFRQGDVLKVKDLSDATVVLLYMGDDINNRLKPILKETLKPGARVVSHRFLMGEWKPNKTETINSTAGYSCDIHLWQIMESTKKN